MKRIANLEDLRYRKLYLRSELKLKEQRIGNHVSQIREEINNVDFKNELMQTAMKNPALIINVARIVYYLTTRIRNRRRRKKSRRKSLKS